MIDMERWLDANDQYLAASVAWLRDRLERLGTETTLALSSADVARPAQPRWRRGDRSSGGFSGPSPRPKRRRP
jgi:hypothetical protein